jgi:hypothetical protein
VAPSPQIAEIQAGFRNTPSIRSKTRIGNAATAADRKRLPPSGV